MRLDEATRLGKFCGKASMVEHSRFFRVILSLELLECVAARSRLRSAEGEVSYETQVDVGRSPGLTIQDKTKEQTALEIAGVRRFHSSFDSFVPRSSVSLTILSVEGQNMDLVMRIIPSQCWQHVPGWDGC
jgi:hypothetical protein